MFTGEWKARGPKTWRYSMNDMAEASGRTKRQVSEDIKAGVLDPMSLESLVRYVAGHMMLNETRRSKRR